MDTFVKTFFNTATSPGVPFVFDQTPATWCYNQGVIEIDVNNRPTSVPKEIRQPMTPLGLLDATYVGLGSSYDGLTKHYLTPEGQIFFTAIHDTLRSISGQPPAVFSSLIGDFLSYDWSENQTSLLINMFRYVILKKISEENNNLDGAFGQFEEGDLKIDMDQWWPEGYKRECAFDTWPTQPTEADDDGYEHVVATHLVQAWPTTREDAIDLRNLDDNGALFVLIMLNGWKRSSRMRVDFDSPALVPSVYFRGWPVGNTYTEWANGKSQIPLLSADAAWHALCKYVSVNRLFHNFSVAIYVMSLLTYQYLPETAEGTLWLAQHWVVTLPTFHACRGRFVFFNSGVPAYLTTRPLEEYNFVANKLEKFNLMALTFSQAFHTGLAIRATRRGLETTTDDLENTTADFYSEDRLISAAVSEFTRTEVPLSGMMGIQISTGSWYEYPEDGREVLTENLAGTELPLTHNYGRKTISTRTDAWAEYTEENLPRGTPNRERVLKRYAANRAGALAKQQVDAEAELTEDEEAALRGRIRLPTVRGAQAEYVTVVVQVMPLPGYPTFLVPHEPMTYANPFGLAGKIDESVGFQTRRGNELSIREAWFVAAFLNNVGYEYTLDVRGDYHNGDAYIEGRYSKQVWPVLYELEYDMRDVVILTKVEKVERSNVILPPIENHFLKGNTISFKFHSNARGVAGGEKMKGRPVTRYGNEIRLIKTEVTVAYNLDAASKLVERSTV